MLSLFCIVFMASGEISSQLLFGPISSDVYEIHERLVLTNDDVNDDYYDNTWPSDKMVETVKRDKKKQNHREKDDYDYFAEKKSSREKKQLIEANYTTIEQTTPKMNLSEEYKASLQKNNVFNYTEIGQEDKSFGWILSPIDSEKCAEAIGIGLTALRCINATEGSQRAHIITKFIISWIIIDVFILFCLWCTKGWCCCCCPFQFCKVNERIAETHKYLAINPPGEFTDEEGVRHEYDPTPEEKLIHENMSRSFMII